MNASDKHPEVVSKHTMFSLHSLQTNKQTKKIENFYVTHQIFNQHSFLNIDIRKLKPSFSTIHFLHCPTLSYYIQ